MRCLTFTQRSGEDQEVLRDCLSRWTSDIERTHRHAKKSGHHIVRYRDVATDTETTLQRLCSALDISYAESMMDDYRTEAKAISQNFEEWKNKNTKKISYNGHKKFNKRFNQTEKDFIQNTVDKYNLDELVNV